MASHRAADLEELFKTNNVPSEETVQLIKEMLATPRKNLRDLDEKISKLEQQLHNLKTQRNDDHEWIGRHAAILSPIRDMPVDILQEIFYHCLPANRYPAVKATEGPILLTHICRRWREIAISSGGLWSRLHVVVLDGQPDGSMQPFSFNPEESRDAVEVASARWEPVKEWLSRSGSSPLSLSIDLKGAIGYSYARTMSAELVHTITALFRLLSSFSHRWEHLQLQGSIEAFRLLENTTSNSDLTMLNSLKVDLETMTNPSIVMAQPALDIKPFAFINAPYLRGLSMHINQPMLCGIPDPSVDWTKFTSISSHFPISISDTVFLLQNCRNLVRFKVIATESRVLSGDVGFVYNTPILLPHLRSLCVIEALVPVSMTDVYRNIVAPELCSIGYANKFHSHVQFTDEQLDPILELIQKSPVLQKLTFDAVSLNTPGSLRKILLASHNISHLVIGQEMQAFPKAILGINSRSMTPQRRPRPGTSGTNTWDFNEALANNAQDIESGSPLIPYLEVFDFMNGSINLSDKLLLEFILSRMDPSATNLSVLKHIRINFNRPQEQEISEAIFQRARLAGIKIKLELDYLDPDPEDQDFGGVRIRSLDNNQGPTWNYKDIEDMQ